MSGRLVDFEAVFVDLQPAAAAMAILNSARDNPYYDPRLGRFIAEDPPANAGGSFVRLTQPLSNGLNLYAYVFNDPLAFLDPAGQAAAAGMIAGGIAAGIVICGIYAENRASAKHPSKAGGFTGPNYSQKQHCLFTCVMNRCTLLIFPMLPIVVQHAHERLSPSSDSANDNAAGMWGTWQSYKLWMSCETICDRCEVPGR